MLETSKRKESEREHTWSRFFNFSDNVSHPSFVSQEGSESARLSRIILREGLHWKYQLRVSDRNHLRESKPKIYTSNTHHFRENKHFYVHKFKALFIRLRWIKHITKVQEMDDEINASRHSDINLQAKKITFATLPVSPFPWKETQRTMSWMLKLSVRHTFLLELNTAN